MVETFLSPLGPRLVEACRIGAGVSVLDVASGTGNAAIPAAQRGAHVTASDLTPELLQAGAQVAEAVGDRARLGHRRRRGPPVRGRVLRHRDVLDRRDVRAPPPAGRRRARARVPRRRDDRAAELDARGHARRAVPHDGPVRAAAARRRVAAAAVGLGGAPARAVRRPRRVALAGARGARDHRLRAPAGLRRVLQGPLRPDDRHPRQRRPQRPRGGVRRGARRLLRRVERRHRGRGRASRWSTCSPSARAPRR